MVIRGFADIVAGIAAMASVVTGFVWMDDRHVSVEQYEKDRVNDKRIVNSIGFTVSASHAQLMIQLITIQISQEKLKPNTDLGKVQQLEQNLSIWQKRQEMNEKALIDSKQKET